MELRKAERDCYCRFCDKKIKRNTEEVIAHYTYRNTGQHIFICKECIEKSTELINSKNTILRDSDKAGTKYTDVQLEKPNMIEFGVMKDIKDIPYIDIVDKLKEEFEEVLVELNEKINIKDLASELLDLSQVSFTYLKKLELEGLIEIKAENKKHLKKLDDRGYIL